MRGVVTIIWLVIGGLTASFSLALLFPFGGRRNRAQHTIERLWARSTLAVAGVRVRCSGLDKIPAGPCIVVANHASNLDPLIVMGHLVTEARFVAKSELRWALPLSIGMAATGHIFIKRGSRKSGGRALGAAAASLGRGAKVLFFPEGTRSTATGMLPWKSGAFRLAIEAGAPVLPLAIHGSAALWPSGQKTPRSGKLTAEVLDPISTGGRTKGDIATLRNEVRAQVEAVLDNWVEPA
jgi:1-acyl-sn-glycerol-3-phosphate acyltransferase